MAGMAMADASNETTNARDIVQSFPDSQRPLVDPAFAATMPVGTTRSGISHRRIE
jgi:hypothetical protein